MENEFLNETENTPITEQPIETCEIEEAVEISTEEIATAEEEAEPAVPQKKKLVKQWWFWVIIGVAALALIIGITSGNSGSGSSSSSGSYYVAENPYVTIVKTTKNSKYGITYGAAFNSFFSSPDWDYFKASSGEHVVEFQGKFYYDNSPATATVQFVVDTDAGTLEVYHLSINGVAQSRLMLAALVQKVFESY